MERIENPLETVKSKEEVLREAGVEVLESPIHVAHWAKKYNLR